MIKSGEIPCFDIKAELLRLHFSESRSIGQAMASKQFIDPAVSYICGKLSKSRSAGIKYAFMNAGRLGLKAVLKNLRGLKQIRDSFDAVYYIFNYPEVMEKGMDPLVHYLWYGGYEGCDPNSEFCSEQYLKDYPDVKSSGINPYVHYCLSGRAEKRLAFPSHKADYFADSEYNVKICPQPIKIAFAVTSSSPETGAGDFFTAKELAHSLEKLGCEIKYLDREKNWYNVGTDVDILISMLDSYDPDKAANCSPSLITVAWARNWFDRWCSNPSISKYSLILASSGIACEYMKNALGREVILFPIATNHERFTPDTPPIPEYSCDYVFTGSYWKYARDITDVIEPQKFPYKFKVFGMNWENDPKMAPYNCGFLMYEDMPKVYSSTRIVIDDANHVTKKYGAVNSRVYDAIAAGKLVITNGTEGAAETFNGILPAFSDKEGFEKLLTFYMENDEAYKSKTEELRRFVLENHTYDIRAKKLLEIIYNYLIK
ncbi:MAG: glycosyltransferase [Huintestinicola sp.]